jgi:hypothetical protein
MTVTIGQQFGAWEVVEFDATGRRAGCQAWSPMNAAVECDYQRCSGKRISGQNCFQRLRSLRMKPWIIAALICSACAAYAAEDDNKIHPTCVEENNTRRCWVDHGPPTGVRPPQLQPVVPAPQAAIPPPAPIITSGSSTRLSKTTLNWRSRTSC